MTPLPRNRKATRTRLFIAIGLGAFAIVGSLLLAAADVIRGSVNWAHHSPASAAPLFLIAAAIAAVSLGRPPNGRHGLLRLVAVLAFTAWGTAQVMPNPAATSALNDAAILLFVIDGGCAVLAEARAILAHYRRPDQPTTRQASQSALIRRSRRATGRHPGKVVLLDHAVQDPYNRVHAQQSRVGVDRPVRFEHDGCSHHRDSGPWRIPAEDSAPSTRDTGWCGL